MTTQLAPTPVFKAFDNNGLPLANGMLYSYIAGTTTPQATYTDSTGSTPNANPVVLNARGEANVWLNPTQGYKLVLTDSLGNQIWSVDGIIGPVNINQSLIPAADNTYSLGSTTAAWAQLYLGANHAPALNGGIVGYWPQTAAEFAAGVAPTIYSYQPGDLRRYGADPTGVNDSTVAITNFFAVALANGGLSARLSPGTYKITSTVTVNMTPSTGANAETYGLTLLADGVVFNYTGNSYAFDFVSANTEATMHGPLLAVHGANLLCTAAAAGGFRCRSVSGPGVRWWDCFVYGATAGAAWTELNDTAWCENHHYRGCGAVNCRTIISFQVTGGTTSFARTYVDGMFGAGIGDYWFEVGGGTAVYDSRFTHLSGNFTSLAYFSIGAAGSDADMEGTVIDGLDCEANAAIASTWTAGLAAGATAATLAAAWTHPTGTYTAIFSDGETRAATYTNGSTAVTWTTGLTGAVTTAAIVQQGIFRLFNYPNTAGVARRPIILNIPYDATAIGNALQAQFPHWLDNNGASIAGPESEQTQAITTDSPLQSAWGQSEVYEGSFGINAVKDVATYSDDVVNVNVTGCSAAVAGRVRIARAGNIISMTVWDTLIGTSNTDAMTLTGLPAYASPTVVAEQIPCFVTNAGAGTLGAATVNLDGSITFAVASAVDAFSASGFGTTGNKGIAAGQTLTWNVG